MPSICVDLQASAADLQPIVAAYGVAFGKSLITGGRLGDRYGRKRVFLLIFVSVAHRYLAGVDIPGVQDWLLRLNFSWAQELCIIMFVWMAKFGAAYDVRTGIHVGVDVLINRLNDNMRGKFIVFGLLAGALFTGIVATLGAHFVWENGAHYAIFNALGIAGEDLYEGPVTPDLKWPTWIVYSAIPLGSSLMCFRFLQVCLAFIRTGELPHHDHGHVDGLEKETPPVDVDVYAMDDNRHPHDLKHTMVGDNRRKAHVKTDPAG